MNVALRSGTFWNRYFDGKKNKKLNGIYDQMDDRKNRRVTIKARKLPSNIPPATSVSWYRSLLSTTMTATSPIVRDSHSWMVLVILSCSSLLKNLSVLILCFLTSLLMRRHRRNHPLRR